MMTTVEIHDHTEPLASEWECLAQQTGASPFLWPGWIDAWWRAFAKGRLQIFAAYQGGRLAGVLPLYRHRGALRSTTNSETPLFGFVAANEMAVKQLLDAVFHQKVRRIDLSLLHSTYLDLSSTCSNSEAANYRVITKSAQRSPYVIIEGQSWSAYESGLRRKFRSELRRRRRRLEEEGQLTLDVSDGKEGWEELFEEGLRVEGSGWKSTQGTSINARPAVRRFYTEVARWAVERGLLRLAFLRLDGRPLAFDYCLEHGRTHYLLKTGYDPDYARFAPGMILRYMMLERAFAEGLVAYDFLGVVDTWKLEWTSAYRELQFLHLFAPTVLGFLDQAAFAGVRLASKRVKSLAQSPVLPERGRRLLEQAPARWHRMLDRRNTS